MEAETTMDSKEMLNRKKQLLEEYQVTEEELTNIDETLAGEIKGAVSFAKKSPFPKPESALEGLFEE